MVTFYRIFLGFDAAGVCRRDIGVRGGQRDGRDGDVVEAVSSWTHRLLKPDSMKAQHGFKSNESNLQC